MTILNWNLLSLISITKAMERSLIHAPLKRRVACNKKREIKIVNYLKKINFNKNYFKRFSTLQYVSHIYLYVYINSNL